MTRLVGLPRVRRLLDRIEPAIRDEIIVSLAIGGRKLLAAMETDAPRRTGALAAGLSMRVYPKTLKLRVGFLGKAVNQVLFYAHILEFGRKAQTVTVTRGGKLYPNGLKVSALKARPFVRSPRNDVRQVMRVELADIWSRALTKAAAGAGSAND